MEDIDLRKVLDYINPTMLNYQEWCSVGMALKHEGYSADVWEDWSAKDVQRYHPGECERKWETFHEDSGSVITGATLVHMAQENGFSFAHPEDDRPLMWDDILDDDYVLIDSAWVEGKEIEEPRDWNPVKQLKEYLEVVFQPEDIIGFVTETWEKDGKYLPTKGSYTKTCRELLEDLGKYPDDITYTIGDYKEEAGAWIRFNPLDGKGVSNDNVTDFRYALVESDSLDLAKQNAIVRELELPVATLTYSGKKSIHAIVRVDANDKDEYRKRVEYLYKVCKKNGLDIDTQNKNPSRLSRMPGVTRNGHKQFLIDTNIGKANWEEWYEWIEGVNDDLPDPEGLNNFWDNLPELAEPLIDGVLRKGHKMLLAGPSKAGKSFALIELCIAIAEGKEWLGFGCKKGRVMYVNLELDRASCLHRFKDVYSSLCIKPKNTSNIDIWNLRGKSVPMDKLAPKLIRRAQKKDYVAIIIDPIYKVITGDENSADQMAAFCNQFDKVCTELGCAVIYCHHHSKGAQGNKRSMDRASGSGVFARDPDALLDLIELETNDSLLKRLKQGAVREACMDIIKTRIPDWKNELSRDDTCSASALLEFCRNKLDKMDMGFLNTNIAQKEAKITQMTAWRIEGTLREFPKFPPVNMYFNYPIHEVDRDGILGDLDPEEVKPAWQKAMEKRKSPEAKKKERGSKLEIAYSSLELAGQKEITYQDLADEAEVSVYTIKRWLKENKNFSTNQKDTNSPVTVNRKN